LFVFFNKKKLAKKLLLKCWLNWQQERSSKFTTDYNLERQKKESERERERDHTFLSPHFQQQELLARAAEREKNYDDSSYCNFGVD